MEEPNGRHTISKWTLWTWGDREPLASKAVRDARGRFVADQAGLSALGIQIISVGGVRRWIGHAEPVHLVPPPLVFTGANLECIFIKRA